MKNCLAVLGIVLLSTVAASAQTPPATPAPAPDEVPAPVANACGPVLNTLTYTAGGSTCTIARNSLEGIVTGAANCEWISVAAARDGARPAGRQREGAQRRARGNVAQGDPGFDPVVQHQHLGAAVERVVRLRRCREQRAGQREAGQVKQLDCGKHVQDQDCAGSRRANRGRPRR